MAQSRTKEIGIRKAIGSSATKITLLMTKEIFFITLIANFLGIAIGLKLINDWLSNFKYHIDISFDTFILVFALSVLIALLTNGLHAIKSSNVNPAKVLRYE
jgi:ABC-type antimicrobial peptide transport system permease subunit